MDITAYFTLEKIIEMILIFIIVYLSNYISQKSKNLATKEDIRDITKRIESVKDEYKRGLEATKVTLANKLHTSNFRYQKEYETFTKILNSLNAIRMYSMGFVQNKDLIAVTSCHKDLESKKRAWADKAVENLCQEYESFLFAYGAMLPLIPVKIGNLLDEFTKKLNPAQMREQTIEERRKILIDKKIDKDIENIMKGIRQRVEEWENPIDRVKKE